MSYNFTVIIPHKDIPELLQRAIDSVPQRDDLQLIVVDDNSDPTKVDFEHFPGLDRPNTEVFFTKEGRGAGYARNVGLDHAQGKWILFADADDEFLTELNQLLDSCLRQTADLFYFNARVHDEYGNEYSFYNLNSNRGTDVLRYEIRTPWCKIIRRDLIENKHIRFEEIRFSNDTFFSIKCAYYAKELCIVDIEAYMYFIRSGTLWQTWTDESIKCRIESAMRYYDFGKEHHDKFIVDAAILCFDLIGGILLNNSKIRFVKYYAKYAWRFGFPFTIFRNYWKAHKL